MQIGKHSQLQEWMADWDNPEDDHRHVSHLYSVFPSNQISPYRTPALFAAARNSLLFRGDRSTGWSMNWKIALWARFLDGNHACKLITEQIKLIPDCDYDRLDYFGPGGTYPNMFDACPPFQIDGNFGFTAGVSEMLVQSHDSAIFVLPALPDMWPHGKVTGLRCRGGFEIESLEWKNNLVFKLRIKSNLGGNCRIRSYNALKAEDGTELKQAIGENANQFYETPVVKEPLISEKANVERVKIKDTFLCDIETRVGEEFGLVGV